MIVFWKEGRKTEKTKKRLSKKAAEVGFSKLGGLGAVHWERLERSADGRSISEGADQTVGEPGGELTGRVQ